MWEGVKQGAIPIAKDLATFWGTLSESQKASWEKIAIRDRIPRYCAFMRFNYQRVKGGLDPLPSPN